MFPEPFKETKNVKVNLSHLHIQGVERICDVFHSRYETEVVNGFFLILIKGLNFDEFLQLLGIYAYFLADGKKLHIVINPPMARTDVHLTAN